MIYLEVFYVMVKQNYLQMPNNDLINKINNSMYMILNECPKKGTVNKLVSDKIVGFKKVCEVFLNIYNTKLSDEEIISKYYECKEILINAEVSKVGVYIDFGYISWITKIGLLIACVIFFLRNDVNSYIYITLQL